MFVIKNKKNSYFCGYLFGSIFMAIIFENREDAQEELPTEDDCIIIEVQEIFSTQILRCNEKNSLH